MPRFIETQRKVIAVAKNGKKTFEYTLYTVEKQKEILDQIKKGNLSMHDIALRYGLPISVLARWLNRHNQDDIRSINDVAINNDTNDKENLPQIKLENPKDEEKIINWIKNTFSKNGAVRRSSVVDYLITNISPFKNETNKDTRRWIYNFIDIHQLDGFVQPI